MQWSQKLGRLVPAIGNEAQSGAWDQGEEENFPISPPPYASQTAQAPTRVAQKPAQRPLNVVALAKARLRDINIELRGHEALKKERDELERLIKAAQKKPAKNNNVRGIVNFAGEKHPSKLGV